MMRSFLGYSLVALVGSVIQTAVAMGATVTWTIDSSASYIRLIIPDQTIPLGEPPVTAGFRDFNGPLFTSPGAASWTDAGGQRSAVQGTISSNYIEGTSITFNAGAHNATAVQFGAFRPDGATWNGTVFDSNSTAPAAFGGSLVLDPGGEFEFVGGFASVRDVAYDLLGSVNLVPSGPNWSGTNNFQAGVIPGAKAHLVTIAGDFNEVLAETVNADSTGGLTIENTGGLNRRLTLVVNVPVAITVDELILNASAVGVIVANATVAAPAAQVVSRSVYHGGYSGAGTPPNNRIDTAKVVAKEGSGPTVLSYTNMINASRGINGLVFDIQNLGNGGALSSADFEVQVSPTGAFDVGANLPASWPAGPTPSSVSVTAGSPDRVLIEWPNNSIMNRWLRLTIKANANTGLSAPETYYVGHLLGETSGLSGTVYTVAFADITPIRADAGLTVNANSITDIDKSGTVSFADISAMRPNIGAQLSNITIP